MELILAILVGTLFAGGLFCILRRSIFRLIVGIILLSQGANLLVFTSGGLTQTAPPFITGKEGLPPELYADPLPQALVLTAIVIGFGLVVFTLSLLNRAYEATGSDDLNEFNNTDQIA